MANKNRVIVQELSSNTAFWRGNGPCVYYDDYAPRLSKKYTLGPAGAHREAFLNDLFSKNACKSYSKMYDSAKISLKNHCCWKPEFLKFVGFSHQNLKTESVVFDHFLIKNWHHTVKARFVPSQNHLFCGTWGTILAYTSSGHHFSLFLSFSVFFSFYIYFCRLQKCVPRLRKTYNS